MACLERLAWHPQAVSANQDACVAQCGVGCRGTVPGAFPRWTPNRQPGDVQDRINQNSAVHKDGTGRKGGANQGACGAAHETWCASDKAQTGTKRQPVVGTVPGGLSRGGPQTASLETSRTESTRVAQCTKMVQAEKVARTRVHAVLRMRRGAPQTRRKQEQRESRLLGRCPGGFHAVDPKQPAWRRPV